MEMVLFVVPEEYKSQLCTGLKSLREMARARFADQAQGRSQGRAPRGDAKNTTTEREKHAPGPAN